MQIYWYTDLSIEPAREKFPLAQIDAVEGQTANLVSLDVIPDDSSYRYRELMGKPTVMLKFALPEYVEIPVGAWIDFFGQKYYLRCPQDIKKQGTRNIEYTLTLYDRTSELGDYKLRNTVDRRLKFSMCAKPHEFLQLIVDNLKERDGDVWEVGEYIDSPEKTLEFNHVFIDDALQSVADEFKTEWSIVPSATADGKYKISLGKVELDMPPLPLSYGRGNGFVPGVGRTSKSDEKPIKRLYVQGGERNIDRSKNLPCLYRGTEAEGDTTSASLLLPIGQYIHYDGKHFEDEVGFDNNSARKYTVDSDGYFIMRTDVESSAVKEDSLDLTDIYPKRIGHVSQFRNGTEGNTEYTEKNHFYDIVDNAPDIPNYKDYLIAGETMSIIFQTGMLAGREFEVDYIHDAKGDVPGHRFKIVPTEIDGITMPDRATGFIPRAADDSYPGDEYAVFGVMLPDSFVCDNATKTGAAWDMFREAVKFLYDHEDQKFTFTGEVQGLWAKRNWERVGRYMTVGAYILFSDSQFATDGVKIRVVGVKEYLNNPYAPTLEISNDVGAASTVSTRLREIDNTEVVISDAKNEIVKYTKRRFRDSVETLSALQEAMGKNFTEAVNPVAIQTMGALVGDESLQFQFGLLNEDMVFVANDVNITYANGVLHMTQRWLQHLTIEQTDITTSDNRRYLKWEMPEWWSRELLSSEGRQFLYAVCARDAVDADYLLTSQPQPLESGGQYNFLVGILSSELDGTRSFVKVYGFTEILPGRITTDRMVSGDGNSYFDMLRNSFALGDKLQFNTSEHPNELILRGAIVQSPSGDSSYIPCYRGVYSPQTQYFKGDTVSYSFDGGTSTFICIKNSTGITPTNAEYWRVLSSKGSDGKSITNITQQWMRTAFYIEPVADHDDWSTEMPDLTDSHPYLWVKTIYEYTVGERCEIVTLACVKGQQGQKGDTGASPALVFRGDYDPTVIYYGYSKRLDCVRFCGRFFVAVLNDNIGADGFTGHNPTSNYWTDFGANFESVATNLVLANMANIGGWILKDNHLISQIGTKDGEISNDYGAENFTPAIILDAVNGEIRQGENIVVNADGITLFDDKGEIAAKIVNKSIGNEAELSEIDATKEIIHSDISKEFYNPASGVDITTQFSDIIDLGTYALGSRISLNKVVMSFTTPCHNTDAVMIFPTVSFYFEIMRGWTVVARYDMMCDRDYSNIPNNYSVSGRWRKSEDSKITINIDGENFAPGEYHIRIVCNLTHKTGVSGASHTNDIQTICDFSFHKSGLQKTLIGSDGMYSCWGNNKYFRACSDGIILRHGDYALKLSNDGIQVARHGNDYVPL